MVTVLTNLTSQPISYRDLTSTSTKTTTKTNAKNNCSSEELQSKSILTNRVDPCDTSDTDEFLSEIEKENKNRQSFTYPKETVSYERDHRSYLVDDLNVGLNAIRVVCPWC